MMLSLRAMTAIMHRDLLLGFRGIGDMMAGLMFFTIIIALVPLALGPDPKALAEIGPAILWIGVLIATLPQMERLFARDAAEGVLDHLVMIPAPLPMIILTKAVAAWLMIGLPMTVFAPLLGMMLGVASVGIASDGILIVMISLAVGSFTLILIGMLAAALVLGARRSGILMAVLVLPLAMPVLIFGTAASAAALNGGNPSDALQLLAGVSLVFLAVVPLLTAISLKQATE